MKAHKQILVSGFAVVLILTGVFATKAFALDKDSFYCLLEAEVLGGYSSVISHSDTLSTADRWSVSPNLKINDNLYWLNLYYGTFDRSSQVAQQEDGGQQTKMTMSHSVSTAFKYTMNPTWSIRPLFFSDWVFVDETQDESFGDGLYDYQDWGGGLESVWTVLREKDRQNDFRIGLRVFKREYPNFISLLTLFDPNGSQEEKEKDFIGYKLSSGFDSSSREGWSWSAESITLYKDFTDKQTIDSNGIRLGDTREDILQYFNGDISHPINDHFRLRLDGQIAFNFSNLDFYDTHNTTGLGDDTFVDNYYDYYSFSLKPSIIYSTEIAKEQVASLQLSYLFYAQLYPDRKIQDVSGVYQSDEEQDFMHTFSARASYPVNKSISWVTVLNYTIADSNQDFERFYLYTYDLWNVLTGFSFKY